MNFIAFEKYPLNNRALNFFYEINTFFKVITLSTFKYLKNRRDHSFSQKDIDLKLAATVQ